MPAKKHVLIPRGFSAGDVPRSALAKFHHMTGPECRALALEGRIEKVAPRMWQLTEEVCATVLATETGNGLLSREVEKWLRDLLRLEMAGAA